MIEYMDAVKKYVRRHGIPAESERAQAVADILGIDVSTAGILAEGRLYSGDDSHIVRPETRSIATYGFVTRGRKMLTRRGPEVMRDNLSAVIDAMNYVNNVHALFCLHVPVEPIPVIVEGEKLVVVIARPNNEPRSILFSACGLNVSEDWNDIARVSEMLVDDNCTEPNNALSRLGWTPIIFAVATGTEARVPAAWIAPDGHWMHGRGAVITIANGLENSQIAELIDVTLRCLDRMSEPINGEECRRVTSILELISSHESHIRTLVDFEETRITELNRKLGELMDSVADARRDVSDRVDAISRMSRGVVASSVDFVSASLSAVDSISAQRPIASCESDASGGTGLTLVAVTHPLVMHLHREDEGCCEDCCADDDYDCDGDCGCHGDYVDAFFDVPPVCITVDTSRDRFGDGITLEDAVSGGHVNHPHISNGGRNCFGGSGGLPDGLADAWGRRDWDSVFRYVTAWLTRHNPEPGSEYVSPSYLISEYGESEHSRSGWIVPDVITPDPVVVAELELIDA